MLLPKTESASSRSGETEPATSGSSETESVPLGSDETKSVPLGLDKAGPSQGVERDGNYALNRLGKLMFAAISSLPPGIPNIDT
jgi:hypothetical protein